MTNFSFTARDAAGKPVEGVLSAANVDEARRLLRAQGKYPLDVKVAGATDSRLKNASVGTAGIKISREEVVQFSNQLAVMLETGVTLSEALTCCAENTDKPQTKRLLEDLRDNVNAGVDFSVALGRHERSFPKIYIALMRASEKSGMMSRLLNRATQYLKDEQEIVRKVRGALTYPSIMFGFALLTTVFLLAFVMPRFTTIYANKGAALPVPTKIMMTLSDGLVHQWMYLLPGTVAAVVGTFLFLRTSSGRRLRDGISIRAPLLGPMFRKLHLSRGLRTIGTMATAGVTLTECVETAGSICSNSYFRALWEDVSNAIQNGKPFSEPLGQSSLVPGAVTRMLASGERGGKLGPVMEQVATFSEAELKEKIHDLTRYIEPVMIMFMGLLIGSVTLALLLPVFSISKVVAS